MAVQKPFLDPQKRVDLAVAELARRSRLSGVVTVVDGDSLAGTTDGAGKPQIFFETEATTVARDYEFRTRNEPIKFDEVYRSKHAISIDQHMTQAVRTTPEEDFFDEVRYATDVLPAAVEAIADRMDAKITAKIVAASDLKITDLALSADGDPEGKSALRQVLAINARLNPTGMPRSGRRLLLGANVWSWLVASDATRLYDPSQALTVYRQGVGGSIANLEIVDGTDILGENEFRVLHPSWCIVPTAAGSLPTSGVAWARKAAYEGWALRMVKGYSLDWDREGTALHTYYKLNELKDEIQRHTKASADAANDGSVAGQPVITDNKLVFTSKNVRMAKGSFTPDTP